MTNLKWLIKTERGFVNSELGYTQDAKEATSFCSFDKALEAYQRVKDKLPRGCEISAVNLPILLSWHVQEPKQGENLVRTD